MKAIDVLKSEIARIRRELERLRAEEAALVRVIAQSDDE